MADRAISRLVLVLIKPSKYDDEGYVMRYLRGVLPSNTLAVLAGLARDVEQAGGFGSVALDLHQMDETVQRIDPRRIVRRFTRPGTRLLVGLCGVQSNQFPRASDLARAFRGLGAQVIVGGFHVSGSIAMHPTGMPPECQALLDAGVTLFKGEAEELWGDVLRDAIEGRLRPFYEAATPPALTGAALPQADPALMRRYAYPYMGTVDAGRGCPFKCSFCTIINVQGRTMRFREPGAIIAAVRENLPRRIDYYFFTDDNFSRNRNWEAIFDGLAALRSEPGGARLQFMMQVDVLAYRIKGFVEKAALAGCSQVFIGMESINSGNLLAAGKKQNDVSDFAHMIDVWHAHGIACHVGYIIGFPFDTPESVRADVRRLRDEIRPDQASFFMLTPLPGSQDHTEMLRRGDWMDDDLNRYDSFHAASRHPNMSADAWNASYREAWSVFYEEGAVKAILRRTADRTYWSLFMNMLWYKYSIFVEQTHPMICGFFRRRLRVERRPGFAIEPRLAFARRRLREYGAWGRGVVRLYFEMQEIWLATRGREQIDANLNDLRRRYAAARERLAARLNPLAIRLRTRHPLNHYWRQTLQNLRHGRVYRINPLRVGWNLLLDAKLSLRFGLALLGSGQLAKSRGQRLATR